MWAGSFVQSRESQQQIEQRHLMVAEQLRRRGIADENVLAVMDQLPRHHFIPLPDRWQAYQDHPVPIGLDQTISQPYIVALMTEKLQLQPQHIVLEIGTGCGYQTAILARLVKQVYTIERLTELAQQARANIDALGINNVSYHIADGMTGWPEPILFDRILCAAAGPSLPSALWAQVADGGKLVIPLEQDGGQVLLLLEKHAQRMTRTMLCYCRFVKLLPGVG